MLYTFHTYQTIIFSLALKHSLHFHVQSFSSYHSLSNPSSFLAFRRLIKSAKFDDDSRPVLHCPSHANTTFAVLILKIVDHLNQDISIYYIRWNYFKLKE
ncbi:hypothetical protein EYC84_009812 [Monilinia fructicola]|uniref:Uncharacterized protein n=1 Tax=Monilinia fructicola TaxID=38448 RepID=A0A5M9JDW1_MONFR|nr:hypothetical protein EYC84_009812 [Monilinia fructicola]